MANISRGLPPRPPPSAHRDELSSCMLTRGKGGPPIPMVDPDPPALPQECPSVDFVSQRIRPKRNIDEIESFRKQYAEKKRATAQQVPEIEEGFIVESEASKKKELLDDAEKEEDTTECANAPSQPSQTKVAGCVPERFKSWKVVPRYTLLRTLGHGSYGEVAEAYDTWMECKVAIKRINRFFDQDVDAKRILREIYILRHIVHEQIIKLQDVVAVPSEDNAFVELYLVFEFVDTDLQKLILSPQYLTTEHIQTFLYQMLLGLKYIHSAHVIHRDMKPANILLNEDCSLKVCDFGLARVVPERHLNPRNRPPAVPAFPRDPQPPSSGTQQIQAEKIAGQTKGNTVADHGSALQGGHSHNGSTKKAPTLIQKAGKNTENYAQASILKEHKCQEMKPPQTIPKLHKKQECIKRFHQPEITVTAASLNTPKPPILKRQLTKHVVTRWYRAPELILLQDYTSAVDMWSLGCIFAELLSMEEESVKNFKDRAPLFPGKSCFPLSADKPTSYTDKLDQLNVIFDVIGTPNPEDVESLGEVKQYLKRLSHKAPANLDFRYPGAPPEALDLLRSMLKFNPSKRISVAEALDHPYLAPVRKPRKEIKAPEPIRLDFEDLKMTKEDLKTRITEEVTYFAEANSEYSECCNQNPTEYDEQTHESLGRK